MNTTTHPPPPPPHHHHHHHPPHPTPPHPTPHPPTTPPPARAHTHTHNWMINLRRVPGCGYLWLLFRFVLGLWSWNIAVTSHERYGYCQENWPCSKGTALYILYIDDIWYPGTGSFTERDFIESHPYNTKDAISNPYYKFLVSVLERWID